MLELKNVTKISNHYPQVENVSLSVREGEIFGLLAPDAAGKTTILRLLLTVLQPDQGEIIYGDKKIKKLVPRFFGYIPQMRGIYPRAKVITYLVYNGVLNQLSKSSAYHAAIDMLHQFELFPLAEFRLEDLNTEFQEKILIIATILHQPSIWIIDEPYSGFSPANESLIESLVAQFKYDNKFIIIASRNLDRAEKICERVCLLDKGHLILNLTLPEIKTQIKDNIFYLETADDISALKQIKEIQIKQEIKNQYKITLRDKSFDAYKLISALNKNIRIIKFEQFRPGLAYIYTQLVKNMQRSKK